MTNANFIRSDLGETDITDADFTEAIIDKEATLSTQVPMLCCLRKESRHWRGHAREPWADRVLTVNQSSAWRDPPQQTVRNRRVLQRIQCWLNHKASRCQQKLLRLGNSGAVRKINREAPPAVFNCAGGSVTPNFSTIANPGSPDPSTSFTFVVVASPRLRSGQGIDSKLNRTAGRQCGSTEQQARYNKPAHHVPNLACICEKLVYFVSALMRVRWDSPARNDHETATKLY
eukprot:6577353-Pyramimonas_sp.AAC.1